MGHDPSLDFHPGLWPERATPLNEIAAERLRQIEAEGWTQEHDDAHDQGELARVAACYAWASRMDGGTRDLFRSTGWYEAAVFRRLWPWAIRWWKPTDPRRDLIKAGALIVAEIERLDRLAAKQAEAKEPTQ